MSRASELTLSLRYSVRIDEECIIMHHDFNWGQRFWKANAIAIGFTYMLLVAILLYQVLSVLEYEIWRCYYRCCIYGKVIAKLLLRIK